MISVETIIEALLFAAGDPIDIDELIRVTNSTEVEVNCAIEKLRKKYDDESGIKLLVYGNNLQFATVPEAADYIENLLYPIQKKNFSKAALEILSIIAYKQPITRSEIEAIRGVQCDKSVLNLINLGLVEEQGHKDTLGRPKLYGTSDKFLVKFGLSSITDLPSRDITVLIPAEE